MLLIKFVRWFKKKPLNSLGFNKVLKISIIQIKKLWKLMVKFGDIFLGTVNLMTSFKNKTSDKLYLRKIWLMKESFLFSQWKLFCTSLSIICCRNQNLVARAKIRCQKFNILHKICKKWKFNLISKIKCLLKMTNN